MSWQHGADWFEMRDQRPRLERATWIPLFIRRKLINVGRSGYDGYVEEYLGTHAIMFPRRKREAALQVEWSDAQVAHSTRPHFEGGRFFRAGRFEAMHADLVGRYLVLLQQFSGSIPTECYLDQDLFLALRLTQDGDKWLRPDEDFEDVIRIHRNDTCEIDQVDIRADHLKDYLCARKAGLLISTYRSRTEIHADAPGFTLEEPPLADSNLASWEGCVTEIAEGGAKYGSVMSVLRIRSTNAEGREDVPVFPRGEHTSVETQEFARLGPKLHLAAGELWRNEWISPGERSDRVRRDRSTEQVNFVIETDGTRVPGQHLVAERRWLWFRPEVICTALAKRGAYLQWYTAETGGIYMISTGSLHFGLNSEGFINIFAKDIGELPISGQRFWAAFNVAPYGPVSAELLSAQMACQVAPTEAPEVLFAASLTKLAQIGRQLFGEELLTSHDHVSSILDRIHRFRALDSPGFFSLAKDVCRVLIDRFSMPFLKRLTPTEDPGLGSIKRLEKLLSGCGLDGRLMTAPFVGIYELRHADAHLPSSQLSESFDLLQLVVNDDWMSMGRKLIRKAADATNDIAESMPSWER